MEGAMAFRPNYQQQRGDRNRAKDLKKREKLARREEDAARRRAVRGDGTAADVDAGSPAIENPER
jgi:hypothetical protein